MGMSTVKEQDAKAAYAAFLEFKDVVKKNPIKPAEPATPAALSSKLGAVEAAAGKLSSAAYPLIKDVDWTSDLSLKPLPGASPNQVLKAIDKALVMGASMDGAMLKDAAKAHSKAIGSGECGAWQGDRVSADQPGHGCLQRFRQDRESGRPELPFQLGEPRRCTGGLRCTPVLQGRR